MPQGFRFQNGKLRKSGLAHVQLVTLQMLIICLVDISKYYPSVVSAKPKIRMPVTQTLFLKARVKYALRSRMIHLCVWKSIF